MKTIYFVHDQQESPAPRVQILEMAGFDVKIMRDGAELCAAIEEAPPAVVVLDVLLEGLNGFRVCEEVVERNLGRTFPIVICTQIYRARQFRDEALRLGAQDYLLLPMPLEDFAFRVREAIAGHGARAPEAGQEQAA